MIVTLPIVLLILDFWPLRRLQEKDCGNCRPASLCWLLMEKIPLFLFTLASCVITWLVQQQGGAIDELGQFPLTLELLMSLSTI